MYALRSQWDWLQTHLDPLGYGQRVVVVGFWRHIGGKGLVSTTSRDACAPFNSLGEEPLVDICDCIILIFLFVSRYFLKMLPLAAFLILCSIEAFLCPLEAVACSSYVLQVHSLPSNWSFACMYLDTHRLVRVPGVFFSSIVVYTQLCSTFCIDLRRFYEHVIRYCLQLHH